MPNAESHFANFFLLPKDRIRGWVEHRSAYEGYGYASATVDLSLDQLPRRFPTPGVAEQHARYKVEMRKNTLSLMEEDRKNPNMDPEEAKALDKLINELRYIVQFTEQVVSEDWDNDNIGDKNQSGLVVALMEVFVERCESHCPLCRNLGHTFKTCPNKRCKLCKNANHLQVKCFYRCECGDGRVHRKDKCPHRPNSKHMPFPQKSARRRKPPKDSNGFQPVGMIQTANHANIREQEGYRQRT